MTLEELADLPSDKLEALTDDELRAILSPFFNVTRPEQIVKHTEPAKVTDVMKTFTPAKQAALKALEEQGVDLSFLRKKKR